MKLDYNRIDPELREGASEELALRVDRAGLAALRQALAAAPSAVEAPAVLTQHHMLEAESLKTKVILYRKSERSNQPCLLWLHGGGYILGDADDNRAKQWRLISISRWPRWIIGWRRSTLFLRD